MVDFIGLALRVGAVVFAAVSVVQAVFSRYGRSHMMAWGAACGVVVLGIGVRALLRRPADKEKCSRCGGISTGLSDSLGPRIDTILRAEALVAAVLILLAFCEHSEMTTSKAYFAALLTGVTAVTVAAAFGRCDSCEECGATRYKVVGS
jgi:hypothetical protein